MDSFIIAVYINSVFTERFVNERQYDCIDSFLIVLLDNLILKAAKTLVTLRIFLA